MRIHAPVDPRRPILAVLALMAAGLLCAGATEAAPQTVKTVTVIGNGGLSGGNIPGARENAIEDGLVSALKTAAAGLLTPGALVSHFPTLNELLFERTRQYVQDYKVLAEFRHGGGYRLLVQVSVMTDKVERELRDVGILAREKLLPGILFMIAERNPGDGPPQYWWAHAETTFLATAAEIAMTRAMGDVGYAIVDHGFLAPEAERKVAALFAGPNAGDLEAIELARVTGAEVVVVGTSSAEETLNAKGDALKSFRGRLTARAVRTDTGEVIAATEQTALAAHTEAVAGGRAAIALAAELAAGELAEKIGGAWGRQARGPEVVEVTLSGTRHLAGFVKLRQIMSRTPGVGGIQVREIGVNNATLWVNYESDSDSLATALILNDFETFGIRIADIASGRMAIDIVQPEKGPEEPPAPATE